LFDFTCVRDAPSDEWKLEKFSWAEPVGDIDGVHEFLHYRGAKLCQLFDSTKSVDD